MKHTIDTAPHNQRVIIYGNHAAGHDEMAMAWLDMIDNIWYYAPQGGTVEWNVTHWRSIPDEDVNTTVLRNMYTWMSRVKFYHPRDEIRAAEFAEHILKIIT